MGIKDNICELTYAGNYQVGNYQVGNYQASPTDAEGIRLGDKES